MREFPIRTADQLPALLQACRKEAGLTQAEAALRLGVTQQTYSALERNAKKMSAGRLLKLLGLLKVDLVLRPQQEGPAEAAQNAPSSSTTGGTRDDAPPPGPVW